MIDDFIEKSGLKALVLASLSGLEYSIILYLMDCAYSGADPMIATDEELAGVFGASQIQMETALLSLKERNIIQFKNTPPPYCLSFQPKWEEWQTDILVQDSPEASIYRLERAPSPILSVVSQLVSSATPDQTCQRIMDWFTMEHKIPQEFLSRELGCAKELAQKYPVDLILIFIRHFKKRIPSLEVLLASWDQYLEMYEVETEKIDFLDAKKKQTEMDAILRDNAQKWLESPQSVHFLSEELYILKLLIQHKHPRRQLFWAYQMRSRYQNLMGFFEENAKFMISAKHTHPPHK
jgi:hypothetical protein